MSFLRQQMSSIGCVFLALFTHLNQGNRINTIRLHSSKHTPRLTAYCAEREKKTGLCGPGCCGCQVHSFCLLSILGIDSAMKLSVSRSGFTSFSQVKLDSRKVVS